MDKQAPIGNSTFTGDLVSHEVSFVNRRVGLSGTCTGVWSKGDKPDTAAYFTLSTGPHNSLQFWGYITGFEAGQFSFVASGAICNGDGLEVDLPAELCDPTRYDALRETID